MAKIRMFFTLVLIYLSIAGLVTFSLFIHEEAIQTTMFGTWPAKDAKRWDVVLDGIDLIKKINFSMKVINYSVGWIQPLAFLSYRAYGKAADYYVNALSTETFANAPDLFIDRMVDVSFKPKKIIHLENGQYLAVNNNLGFFTNSRSGLQRRRIIGRLVKDGKYFIIQEEQ